MKLTIEERLMRRRSVTDDGCWLWTGSTSREGYGVMRGPVRTRLFSVHRMAWEALRGPIPDGLELDHLCRVRSCFNPDHLEPVTPDENKRRVRNAASECIHGHEFTDSNTIMWPSDGYRRCRECQRQRVARRRAARSAR